MVRTVVQVEDEGTPDSSSPLESKRVDQKGNVLRSKHSETEQRRRSKINERFQILRDLIPENDQKRDKASFLLEVIQYIQFLHEKLQMYEGSCQAWSSEPTKLSPWKINSGSIESFVDQSHIERLLSDYEDNVVHSPTFLSNAQNSVESDLTGAALQNPTDRLQTLANQCLPLNIPLQSPMFEVAPDKPHQQSFCDAEHFNQQPRSNFWRGSSCRDYYSFPLYTANEGELKTENGEASVSSAYSHGLLNSLTNALRSSGVDLSRANITVQLDIGKQTNDRSTATLSDMEDHENPSGFHSVASAHISQNHEYPHKRLRAGQS